MDLRERLESLGIGTAGEEHHHGRPGWVQIDCPWCGAGSHKFHLGINLEKGYANCWRCGPHRLYEVVLEITGDKRAAARIAAYVESPLGIKPRIIKEQIALREPKGRGPLKPAHRRYLKRRGFDPDEIVRLWQVEGIGIHSQLPWRLYIPIVREGRRVNWTTRAIGNVGPKYKSAGATDGGMPIHKLLYGEDYCRASVIVTEGPFDVWAIGPGAVATFGVSYSAEQVARIASYPLRAICFDSDLAGRRAMARLLRDLAGLPGETIAVELESGDDPASADRVELAELRRLVGLAPSL